MGEARVIESSQSRGESAGAGFVSLGGDDSVAVIVFSTYDDNLA